jgi:hypothetical protein
LNRVKIFHSLATRLTQGVDTVVLEVPEEQLALEVLAESGVVLEIRPPKVIPALQDLLAQTD